MYPAIRLSSRKCAINSVCNYGVCMEERCKLPQRYTCKPAELAAGRRPRKNFGLAAVDFAKPPAAGEKKFG